MWNEEACFGKCCGQPLPWLDCKGIWELGVWLSAWSLSMSVQQCQLKHGHQAKTVSPCPVLVPVRERLAHFSFYWFAKEELNSGLSTY